MRLSVVFTMLLASFIFAAPSTYIIPKLNPSKTIHLDGSLFEWNEAYFIDSMRNGNNCLAWDVGWEWTTEKFNYKVYAAHDENKVYFAFKTLHNFSLQAGTSTGCDDSYKINPGGQAMAFYIFFNGAIRINPSCPYTQGSTLFTAVNTIGNGVGLPTVEFSLDKSVLDPFNMGTFQINTGFEEGDSPSSDCMKTIYGGIGLEYTGNKQDWSSSPWDNPLYFPTFNLGDTFPAEPETLVTSDTLELVPMPNPTFNPKPVFHWFPYPGATTYTFQIDTNSLFISPIISIPTSDTFFRPLADLPLKTVYWRVGAGQPLVFSNINSFRIRDPAVPVLISYNPTPTVEKRPLLQWHTVAGATGYQIHIAQDSLFSDLQLSSPVSDTFFRPLSNLAIGKNYWRVKSNLSETWSEWNSFYLQPDTIPLLYPFQGEKVSLRRPLFRWHPLARAETYLIHVDTTKTFTARIISLQVSDTSFAPLANLNYRTYYWRVSSSLNFNVYSPVDSIVIVPGIGVEEENEVNSVSFDAFPNPFNPVLTIRIPENLGAKRMEIFSVNGRKVARMDVVAKERVMWDASRFSAGVYVVRVVGEKGTMEKRISYIK